MRIDWWTLTLQAVNLLVLFWILKRFLFEPVAAVITERQAAATKLLDDARSVRKAADAEREQTSTAVTRLAEARAQLIAAAEAEAQAEKAALLGQAKTEATELLTRAHEEIERARERQAIEAADLASQLAVDITAKVLARLPADVQVAGFIDGVAAGIAHLPAATRSELGTGAVPLHLKAARPLTDAEATSFRAALTRAVGRPVEFVVDPDPGLIAGLEVEGRHARVRNSLRADLDRVVNELTRHDQPK